MNRELFNQSIINMDIIIQNKCIELLFFFDKFSLKNIPVNTTEEAHIRFLVKLYNRLYKNTDILLTEYEKIKKENKDYVKTIFSRLEKDLDNIFEEVNEILRKQ